MRKVDKPLRVEVEWIDSGTARVDAGWESKKRITDAVTIGSVFSTGYVLGTDRNRGVLYLVQSFDPDHENFLNAQAIDSRSIIDIQVLRARESIVFDNLPD